MQRCMRLPFCPGDTLAKFPVEPTRDGISVAEAADERPRPLFENPPGAVIVGATLGAVVGQRHERRIFAWSSHVCGVGKSQSG